MRDGEGVRTGRPTKLTPEVSADVCEAIRLGMPYELAALSAGISERTFSSWRERGENGEQPFATFLRDLKRAEADGLRDWLARLGDPDDDKWQRWAWKAERRFPQHFALRARLEHTGADGGPIRARVEHAVDVRTLQAAAALLDEAEADTVREAEAAVSEAASGVNGHANGHVANGNGNGNGHGPH